MFDIGFSEVLLIFVIALVVLGPEKLPRLASQVGRWIGRARSMARQFREQLEEEVNLEQVRKAQEQKPKTTTTADAVSGQQTQEPAGSATSGSPESGTAQGEHPSGADQAGVQQHDAQQPHSSDTSNSGYAGPDPADFRADTFSHAHPTNEYGANPYTSNGAAAEPTPSATSDAPGSSASTEAAPIGSDADAHGTSPAQSQFAFDPRVPSEANVAAAQPQAETGSEQRSAPDEGYAPRRPRDNTPGTDNHGN
jgi:sec-independent protein translocase protein TatB